MDTTGIHRGEQPNPLYYAGISKQAAAFRNGQSNVVIILQAAQQAHDVSNMPPAIAMVNIGNKYFHYRQPAKAVGRSEEHTSELQSLMRISYAVLCLNKK